MSLNTDNLLHKFGNNLKLNENLSRYNWFNLGGPAQIFFRPESKSQLIEFLKDLKNIDLKIHVLGAGSNTLVRDKGYNGAVIKIGSKFSNIRLIAKDTIEAESGALDKKVSDFAKENDISNLEFLSCIPGSIGGAVVMNSGCYGSDISKVLVSFKVLDLNGNEKEIKKDEIDFFYRGSNLDSKYIITSVILKGSISSKKIIEAKQNELILKKQNSQPNKIKTGGSTFKNYDGKKAWMLIKESGCDKLYVGDAKISEKHCNFFVNTGNAKASEMEELINRVKQEVKNKTGAKLELEIKIIGEKQ